jgi:hypothetical protein
VHIPFQVFLAHLIFNLLFGRSEPITKRIDWIWVSKWHTHPPFGFPTAHLFHLLLGRRIDQNSLRYGNLEWRTYLPFRGSFPLYISLPSYGYLSFFPGRKHKSKNEWDIDTWVHTPFQSFFPTALSFLSLLFKRSTQLTTEWTKIWSIGGYQQES